MWQQVIRFKYKYFYYSVLRNIQELTSRLLWFGRHVLFYHIQDYILVLQFKVECFCLGSSWASLSCYPDRVSSSLLITQTKQLYSGVPLLSFSPFSPCVTQLKGFPLLPWRCGDNSRMSVQSRPHVPCSVPVKRGGLWGNADWSQIFEKLKLCDFFSLRSCLSYEVVWKVRVVISVVTHST